MQPVLSLPQGALVGNRLFQRRSLFKVPSLLVFWRVRRSCGGVKDFSFCIRRGKISLSIAKLSTTTLLIVWSKYFPVLRVSYQRSFIAVSSLYCIF